MMCFDSMKYFNPKYTYNKNILKYSIVENILYNDINFPLA